jgi:DNA-binding GntR family transcriptional regulator
VASPITQSSLGLPPTRANAILDELRRLIILGEYAAGTPLRQVEVAKRFGVSTTPVREAFTALAQEGLVLQDSHRGVVVFSPSPADVHENYEIRMALESLAAERAARRISDEALDELDVLLERLRTEGRADPVLQSTVLNPRLHAIIAQASGRPRLVSLIEQLRGAAVAYQLVLVGRDFAADGKYVDEVQAEHEEIVAALKAGAPKRAAKAVRAHIEHSLAQVIAAMPDATAAA